METKRADTLKELNRMNVKLKIEKHKKQYRKLGQDWKPFHGTIEELIDKIKGEKI